MALHENDCDCRFRSLREHECAECPDCNPTGWRSIIEGTDGA